MREYGKKNMLLSASKPGFAKASCWNGWSLWLPSQAAEGCQWFYFFPRRMRRHTDQNASQEMLEERRLPPPNPERVWSIRSWSLNNSDLGRLLRLSPVDTVSSNTTQTNGCQETFQPGGCSMGLTIESGVLSIYTVVGCCLSAIVS